MLLRFVRSLDDQLTPAQKAALIASGLISEQTRIVEFVDAPKTASRLLNPGFREIPTVYEIHHGCDLSAEELQKLAIAINSSYRKIRIFRWVQEDGMIAIQELLLPPAYWAGVGRSATPPINDCGAPALVDFD